MPTAGRVTAAILYAGLAFYVSLLVREIFLDERPLPTLPYWNAFFGVILGWRLAGARAGGGLSAAIGYGITTTIALFI
ncbi:MAG: TrgA family protein, partial [Pseudomonadota bacterium]